MEKEELLKQFKNLLDSVEHQFILSILSINLLKTHERDLERKKVLHEYLKKDETSFFSSPDDMKEEKRDQKNLITIKNEITSDYYFNKANIIIYGWTFLESSIYNLINNYFEYNPNFYKHEIFSKIKLPLEIVLSENKQDILDTIVEQYIEKQSFQQKYGFKRFESLLEPLFEKSQLDPKYQDGIYHLAQIRNLIIHKNGIVDKKFLSSIDPKQYKLGEIISIQENDLQLFIESIINYYHDINERVEKKLDVTTQVSAVTVIPKS